MESEIARFARHFGALEQMNSEIGRFAADFNKVFSLIFKVKLCPIAWPDFRSTWLHRKSK